MTVFVDTSAIIAMLDDSQPSHQEALAVWRELRRQDARLVTTNYVLVETFAIVQKRFGWSILGRCLTRQSLSSSCTGCILLFIARPIRSGVRQNNAA